MTTTTKQTPLESMTMEQLQAESERVSGIYHDKVNSDADPRQIGLWRSRNNKVQEALDQKGKEIVEAKESGATVNVRGKQAKRKGSMYCLCGCGAANNPGARFQVGHDARLKPKLRMVEAGHLTKSPAVMAEAFDALPEIVREALHDKDQVFFQKCSNCGGPYLGNQGIGPVCQAEKK